MKVANQMTIIAIEIILIFHQAKNTKMHKLLSKDNEFNLKNKRNIETQMYFVGLHRYRSRCNTDHCRKQCQLRPRLMKL